MKTYEKFLLEQGHHHPIGILQTENKELEALLLRDCGSFLLESNKLFYRGFNEFIMKYEKIVHHKNREPLDTPNMIHDLVNELSEEKFGWRIRDGIFTTPNKYQAGSYGTAYIFMPIGEYKYVHSDSVIDLTGKLVNDGVISIPSKSGSFGADEEVLDSSEYIAYRDSDLLEYVRKLLDTYKEEQLNMSDTETAFMCESYYLIDRQYEDLVLGLIK